MDRIRVYDTTLRDGAQGEGVSFTAPGKLRVARRLDAFGVDYIEAGFAASNPKDREVFASLRDPPLAHARACAFGSTRRAGRPAAEDPGLDALLDAGTPVCTIFGKSWRLHVRDILRTSDDENLAMIRDSVARLRAAGREVIFDAEHFFDGWKDDAAYARAALRAALEAGASTLVLCDTNGGALPDEVAAVVREVAAAFPGAALGIHAHNDGDLAVANTLAAVGAGARHVQGTFNGFGERAGNANLCSILPNLLLKLGYDAACKPQLRELRETAEFVCEMANLRPHPRAPFVGASAFAHKAGMHVDGVRKNRASFEHIEPGDVGNRRRILVSELSGAANIQWKAQELGFDIGRDAPEVRAVLRELEQRERAGYEYENAEGSFALLLHRALDGAPPAFEPVAFRVIVEKRSPDQPCISEATVRLRVGGREEHTVGEGDGPVDALNSALRKALQRAYPDVAEVELTDYSVRILDPREHTAATTRVRIESAAGAQTWETVGVSENILEASWKALLDSLEYRVQQSRRGKDPGSGRPA